MTYRSLRKRSQFCGEITYDADYPTSAAKVSETSRLSHSMNQQRTAGQQEFSRANGAKILLRSSRFWKKYLLENWAYRQGGLNLQLFPARYVELLVHPPTPADSGSRSIFLLVNGVSKRACKRTSSLGPFWRRRARDPDNGLSEYLRLAES
jgi:hypothetical protein